MTLLGRRNDWEEKGEGEGGQGGGEMLEIKEGEGEERKHEEGAREEEDGEWKSVCCRPDYLTYGKFSRVEVSCSGSSRSYPHSL